YLNSYIPLDYGKRGRGGPWGYHDHEIEGKNWEFFEQVFSCGKLGVCHKEPNFLLTFSDKNYLGTDHMFEGASADEFLCPVGLEIVLPKVIPLVQNYNQKQGRNQIIFARKAIYIEQEDP